MSFDVFHKFNPNLKRPLANIFPFPNFPLNLILPPFSIFPSLWILIPKWILSPLLNWGRFVRILKSCVASIAHSYPFSLLLRSGQILGGSRVYRGEGGVRWGGGGWRGGHPGETRCWREEKILERSQTFCRRTCSVLFRFSRLRFHHSARIEASVHILLRFSFCGVLDGNLETFQIQISWLEKCWPSLEANSVEQSWSCGKFKTCNAPKHLPQLPQTGAFQAENVNNQQ